MLNFISSANSAARVYGFSVSALSIMGLPRVVYANELVGTSHIVQTLLTLIGVVAFIFALAYIARRVQHLPGRTNGTLKIVDALALGARERLVLVEVDGERLLVSVAGGRIERIHVIARNSAPSFGQILDRNTLEAAS